MKKDQLLKTKGGEKEIEIILKSFGFRGEDLSRAKSYFQKSKTWVNLMMNHELNIIEDNVEPVKGAMVTILAFVTIGLVPLLGYVFQRFLPMNTESLFIGTCFQLTGIIFVGTVKSRFSKNPGLLADLKHQQSEA